MQDTVKGNDVRREPCAVRGNALGLGAHRLTEQPEQESYRGVRECNQLLYDAFGKVSQLTGASREAFRLCGRPQGDSQVATELTRSSERIPFDDVRFHGHDGSSHLVEDCPSVGVPRPVRFLKSGNHQAMRTLPHMKRSIALHSAMVTRIRRAAEPNERATHRFPAPGVRRTAHGSQ